MILSVKVPKSVERWIINTLKVDYKILNQEALLKEILTRWVSTSLDSGDETFREQIDSDLFEGGVTEDLERKKLIKFVGKDD